MQEAQEAARSGVQLRQEALRRGDGGDDDDSTLHRVATLGRKRKSPKKLPPSALFEKAGGEQATSTANAPPPPIKPRKSMRRTKFTVGALAANFDSGCIRKSTKYRHGAGKSRRQSKQPESTLAVALPPAPTACSVYRRNDGAERCVNRGPLPHTLTRQCQPRVLLRFVRTGPLWRHQPRVHSDFGASRSKTCNLLFGCKLAVLDCSLSFRASPPLPVCISAIHTRMHRCHSHLHASVPSTPGEELPPPVPPAVRGGGGTGRGGSSPAGDTSVPSTPACIGAIHTRMRRCHPHPHASWMHPVSDSSGCPCCLRYFTGFGNRCVRVVFHYLGLNDCNCPNAHFNHAFWFFSSLLFFFFKACTSAKLVTTCARLQAFEPIRKSRKRTLFKRP
jgi:hypothetical protein